MSLKLIQEANVLSKLNPDEIVAYTTIKDATGKDTIAEMVIEAYTPTRSDYRKWLSVVVGYLKESGSPITKDLFCDTAGAMFENDPKGSPPVEMHSAIMNKLWADYKASKNHAKVMKLAAKAQEEEEFDTADTVDDLGDTHEPGHRRESDDYDSTEKFGAAERDEPEEELDHEDKHVCPECGCEFSDDEDEPEDEYKPEDDEPENHEPEDDLGNRVEGAERLGRTGQGPDGGHVGDEDISYQEEETTSRHDGSRVARMHQAMPTKPKSILQQVLTAPREQMNAALKDIEADGSAAWVAHKLPENPHAKGSIAHRKWASGLKKAMKTHLGLDAVPAATKPKKR